MESDPVAANEIRAALAAAGDGSFEVEWVRQLSQGLERLSKKGIAAVLLALSLPDSQGSFPSMSSRLTSPLSTRSAPIPMTLQS
jgi:DNA-binding response OmpR family regulator